MAKPTKVVIGDEWTGNDKVEYTCNYCNRVLVKLQDSSGKNSSLWCRTCSIEYPDENEVRKKSKLETPNKNIEPCVTSIQTNMRDEVEISIRLKYVAGWRN